MSEDKRPQGRPVGSTRKNGFLMNKMSGVEVEEFIKESTKLIFDKHLSWTEYIEWARKQGVSRAQANEYWKRVWNLVKERFKLEKDELINKHLLKYWNIHDKAVENKDYNTARQALNDIAKLLGMNEPTKMDVNQTGIIEFKWGDDTDE